MYRSIKILSVAVLCQFASMPAWADSGASTKTTTINVSTSDVVVIDGDTLQIRGKEVQLYGIDAPELGQVCKRHDQLWLCGMTAARELRKFIEMAVPRRLRCVEIDKSGQIPQAMCDSGGVDLASMLIESGFAKATPQASFQMKIMEEQAKTASLGIWNGEFVSPDAWRDGTRLPEEHRFGLHDHLRNHQAWTMTKEGLKHHPLGEKAACLVKGKYFGGQRYYVGPLDAGYDDIDIDPARGDRLYCGDDQARADGFHHAKPVMLSLKVR